MVVHLLLYSRAKIDILKSKEEVMNTTAAFV